MGKQKVIDSLLKSANDKIQEEMGALLGLEFVCDAHTTRFINKEDYLCRSAAKAVVAKMAVSGEKTGEAYLLTTLNDAIVLGGNLILLPPDEIESRQKEQVFDGEVADAFGEIANIVAGVYAAIFLDLSSKDLHFKKTDQEDFIPGKVDPEGPTPFPATTYYLSSTSLNMDGAQLGQMEILIPADILDLESPEEEKAAEQSKAAEDGSRTVGGAAQAPSEPGSRTVGGAEAQAPSEPGSRTVGGEGAQAPSEPGSRTLGAAEAQELYGVAQGSTGGLQPQREADLAEEVEGPPLILIASDALEEAETLASLLGDQDWEVLCLNLQENLREAVKARDLKVVFLVMTEVGERGFASIIKIQSAVKPATPLVVAGPEWTRKTVLQAVKYGACDVLMTPLTAKELVSKIDRHARPGKPSAA